jgi:hypothetical protein
VTAADRSRLLEEVDRLEQQHSRVAEIAVRTDDNRQRDLIQLRRQLAECIARVGEAGERYFRGQPDQSRMAEFRSLFSTMRAKTAAHQANWPAVKLTEGSNDYARSAQGVNDAIKGFIAWVRRTA